MRDAVNSPYGFPNTRQRARSPLAINSHCQETRQLLIARSLHA